MRFIHTSDWHIGRILFERSLIQDQEYILEQFVDLVRRSEVDAVIIAGDIYDRAIPPREAVLLLDDVLSRIALQAKTPVFMISGNHDSGERLGFGSKLFADRQLRIVSSISSMLNPFELEDKHGRVRFYGIPYFDPADVRVESKIAEMQSHDAAMAWCLERLNQNFDPSVASVAVAHGFLAGGEESPDSERPLAIGGTSLINAGQFSRFNYTALGHLHRPQNLGKSNVRYSGSLLPYSFEEARGAKTISIVELGADRVARVEEVSLNPLRKMRILEGALDSILQAGAADPGRDDFILVRRDDDGPVLDPLGRLRAVYKNVLSVERVRRDPSSLSAASSAARAALRQKIPTDELFRRFFADVTGGELNPDHLKRVADDMKVDE
ncbi:MAG: exonuclease SbcCD subunit D [Proteobacteria bacterium]|nr:MAG: exonuclease SbcCD subunit D [Pseudomonadota bacterium]